MGHTPYAIAWKNIPTGSSIRSGRGGATGAGEGVLGAAR